MGNQNGFTMIELIVVIVILGILSAVAVPKFLDLKTDAEISSAKGVYGAAQSATALNHAAKLVGKAVDARPAYDATDCVGGLIVDGNCLAAALDGGLPDGWSVAGTGISKTVGETTYAITVETPESSTDKAVLSTSGF